MPKVQGSVIRHTSTYRIYLRKAGTDRIARIMDSAYHPYTRDGVRFIINEKGVDDAAQEKKSKKVHGDTSAEE